MMNKVALVTGASRGIGEAIAIKLAESGFDVMINFAGNLSRAEEVKKKCEDFGVRALIFKADVGIKNDCENLVKKTIDEFGSIDLLVNNAGITRDSMFLRMNDADFESVINVNLTGVFYLTKLVAKIMFKKRKGKIVNITSVSGITGNVGQANYAAAKAGVIGFTKTIAKELAPRGICVNAVAPGFIETDMTAVLDDSFKQKIVEQIPLNRFGTTSDIADMVDFLASSSADYITGQVFQVDGGLVI